MALDNTTEWSSGPGTSDGLLVGRNDTSKVGFCGAVPIVRGVLPAAAIDLATAITLVNAIRSFLIARGDCT